MKNFTNVEGVVVFLLSPFICYATVFCYVNLSDKLEMLVSLTALISQGVFYYHFALYLFFIFAFFLMWQIIKRINSPSLSTRFMLIVIFLYNVKGVLCYSTRVFINPWMSLWLFAPFLLVACLHGRGQEYLKKYLWLPILMDALVIVRDYIVDAPVSFFSDIKFGGITVLFTLLFVHVLFFIGFVQYTSRTHNLNETRWKIPTIWLGIPAFTVGLLFTALFFIMF